MSAQIRFENSYSSVYNTFGKFTCGDPMRITTQTEALNFLQKLSKTPECQTTTLYRSGIIYEPADAAEIGVWIEEDITEIISYLKKQLENKHQSPPLKGRVAEMVREINEREKRK